MTAHPRRRTGFTLVEMLVVITIIGTLMAMLLPAIQAARETARSMTCRANLENFAVATDTFENAFGQYPGYQNAVGNIGHYPGGFVSKTPGRKASWVVTLLPYLDQQATFDQWANRPLDQPAPVVYMEVLNCRSDSSQAEQNFPALSYIANAGFGYTVDGNGAPQSPPGPESIHDGVFLDRFDDEHNPYDDRKPNLNKGTLTSGDGLQYTLLFSENLHEARKASNDFFNTWVAIEAPHNKPGLALIEQPVGSNLGAVAAKRYTVFVWFDESDTQIDPSVVRINGQKYNAIVDNTSHMAARPAAFHTGGVNVIFAGGNSQFLRETIDYHVYQQLCTPNDKKSHLPTIYNPLPPPLSDSSFQ